MDFGSKEKYRNWLAYGHMSGEFARVPGNQPISIRGKKHRVRHKQ